MGAYSRVWLEELMAARAADAEKARAKAAAERAKARRAQAKAELAAIKLAAMYLNPGPPPELTDGSFGISRAEACHDVGQLVEQRFLLHKRAIRDAERAEARCRKARRTAVAKRRDAYVKAVPEPVKPAGVGLTFAPFGALAKVGR